jgi:hypothetical protein
VFVLTIYWRKRRRLWLVPLRCYCCWCVNRALYPPWLNNEWNCDPLLLGFACEYNNSVSNKATSFSFSLPSPRIQNYTFLYWLKCSFTPPILNKSEFYPPISLKRQLISLCNSKFSGVWFCGKLTRLRSFWYQFGELLIKLEFCAKLWSWGSEASWYLNFDNSILINNILGG